jgi:ATP-binding cassette subfamily C protein
MDEPNSNLDADGETALTRAIKLIRKRGGIAIVIAHRPSALAAVDLLAVVQGGRMTAFGTKQDILAQMNQSEGVAASAGRPPMRVSMPA